MLDSLRISAERNLVDDPFPFVVHAILARHAWQQHTLFKQLQAQAQLIDAKAPSLKALDQEQLNHLLAQSKRLVQLGHLSKNREDLFTTLAILREMCRRTLGMEPYVVQLLSVLAMFDGYLVQLSPGEGKTLTIGLLAVLYGWTGKPCHIITANDYLAQRDALELKPYYEACGVSVGVVLQSMTQDEKRLAYQSAVVYSTVKQLLADYLTDQITFGGKVNRLTLSVHALQGKTQSTLMMRGLDFAIVDEADNVLIDEAITPMIISGPDEDARMQEATLQACSLCNQLQAQRHYLLDMKHRDVQWTPEGEAILETLSQSLPALWRGKARREDLMSKAVLARDYFVRDQHYVVIDEEVVIVDEGTGRAMPGRSWSYGLHQAVEARAGVPLTHPRKTLARLSFQNYFKLYKCLTGASGTLQTIEYELYFNYRSLTLKVPSRRASQLQINAFQWFKNNEEKMVELVKLVTHLASKGRPVLIGARTIEGSEAVSLALAQAGIEHQLLNAKKTEEESAIVALAGQQGRVTVATNMAGRGTDIKLMPEVIAMGGLCVVALEPHESARVDWQLYGRAGRQGNPGEVFPMVSTQDDLFKKNLPVLFQDFLSWSLPRIRSQALAHFVSSALVRYVQRLAQSRAFSTRRMMNESTREHRKRLTFSRYE